MRAGDALVLRPDTWLQPRFNTRHRHLGVVLVRDLVRVSWNRCEGREDLPQPLASEGETTAPMPEHSPLARAADTLVALDPEHDAAAAPHLVLSFLHLLRSAAARPRAPADGAERTWLQARHWLQDNCHLPIGRDDAARALGLSPNYLSRLCRARARRTLVEVITDLRLERACAMLRAVDLPLAEIARPCGFTEAGYFIRRFRRAYGTTPAAYRRAQKRG
jgi:AraC-like DNA-binding protein